MAHEYITSSIGNYMDIYLYNFYPHVAIEIFIKENQCEIPYLVKGMNAVNPTSIITVQLTSKSPDVKFQTKWLTVETYALSNPMILCCCDSQNERSNLYHLIHTIFHPICHQTKSQCQ